MASAKIGDKLDIILSLVYCSQSTCYTDEIHEVIHKEFKLRLAVNIN